MDNKEGKIIVIEGPDGAGKTTQIKYLLDHYQQKKITTQFIHFPVLNHGVYGYMIAEFLRGEYGSVAHVHPKLVGLLFALDRADHKNKIEEWLAMGHIVLMDRYVYSNIAFQCAKLDSDKKRHDLKNWILTYEFENLRLPRPDITFYLDVPLSHIEQTLSSVRKGDDRSYLNGQSDIHEDSIELQKEVINQYTLLAKSCADIVTISCFDEAAQWLSPESIHHKIVEYLPENF